MAKAKTAYICSSCGGQTPKWQGQCPHCLEWNVLVEGILETTDNKKRFSSWSGQQSAKVERLSAIQSDAVGSQRMTTKISEFDRVLGGGLVPGCVVLLGGDPGIGKSTLLLQVASLMGENESVMYVTGEESLQQVASRAKRLELKPQNITAIAEIELEKILATLEQERPKVAIIDSIQTIYSEALSSAPGSVAQVRECSAQLTRLAKQKNIAILLVGHVTKEGSLAGPKVLEHAVDAVLYFEGDSQSPYRLIRAFKNRFGAINELGAFEMTELGLVSIDNPSALFLSLDRKPAAGSCVFVMQEGQRPLLIEIQALVDDSTLSNPRRLAVGVDYNRLAMLLAVLHKHASLSCVDQDVFINAVGGAKANETACDLPMCISLLSSIRNQALAADIACFGEIGLTGEIRPVQRSEDRIREAAKLGFKRLIVPFRNLPKKPIPGIEIEGVKTLSDAFQIIKQWE